MDYPRKKLDDLMVMPSRSQFSPPRTRREGFANQKLIVLPGAIVHSGLNTPLLSGLMPVAAGFFPAAERHLVERAQPLPDAIIILCLSGRGWVKVGHGKLLPVEADNLVFIAPGKTHTYGADDVNPWSIYWAHFRGSETPGFFDLFGVTNENPVVRLPQGSAERVDFDGVYERLENDYTVANLLSTATRLRVVFTELYRMRAGYDGQTRTDPVERTITWMHDHIHEPANLTKLAHTAALSISHYSTVFHRRTGYSPVDYFLRKKVQHACRLLDTTFMRVDEIAATVGYEDPFYFSRLFRRIMTKSPRAYRAAVKG